MAQAEKTLLAVCCSDFLEEIPVVLANGVSILFEVVPSSASKAIVAVTFT